MSWGNYQLDHLFQLTLNDIWYSPVLFFFISNRSREDNSVQGHKNEQCTAVHILGLLRNLHSGGRNVHWALISRLLWSAVQLQRSPPLINTTSQHFSCPGSAWNSLLRPCVHAQPALLIFSDAAVPWRQHISFSAETAVPPPSSSSSFLPPYYVTLNFESGPR